MAKINGFNVELLVGGKPLKEYVKDGVTYVADPTGNDFVLRINSTTYRKVEVVASVDGLSVMTGKDASTAEGGYLMSPGGKCDIDGFRLNDDKVAKFHFGERSDSYAELLGKPKNVGVIGVVLFAERQVYRDRFLSMGGGGCLEGATKGGGLETFGGGATRGGAASSRSLGHDVGTEFGEESDSKVTRVHFNRGDELTRLTIKYATEESLRQAGIIVDSPLGAEVDPFPADATKPYTGAQPPAGWNPKTGKRD